MMGLRGLGTGTLIATGAVLFVAVIGSLVIIRALGPQPWFALVSAIGSLAAVVVVIFALVTMRQVSSQVDLARQQAASAVEQITVVKEQTDYIRRQVFGELYPTAQIGKCELFLPDRDKYEAEGFEHMQVRGDEPPLSEPVQIPQGKPVELHVRWLLSRSPSVIP